MALYERFRRGVPDYLARHYWWAYLWRAGIWFFDHQPIISAILFGRYRRLVDETLRRFRPAGDDRVLQLTCVYGRLTTELLERTPSGLHIADVAEVQLELVRRKCADTPYDLVPARMDAEALGYRDDVFDLVVVFFLLHEMPPSARRGTLAEVVRVIRPGGRLLIAEYGASPTRHWLYRVRPLRWLLGRLEPFLPGFWREDLDDLLTTVAAWQEKDVERERGGAVVFDGFYRVVGYRVERRDVSLLRSSRS